MLSAQDNNLTGRCWRRGSCTLATASGRPESRGYGSCGVISARTKRASGITTNRLSAPADDFAEADGVRVLSFLQANKRRLPQAPRSPAEKTAKGPLTIQDVADHYLEHKRAEGAKPTAIADAKQKLDTFLPELGKLRVDALNRELLKNVRKKEADRRAKLRTAKGQKQRYREVPLDKQPRRSTASRNFTVLIAALNQAVEDSLIHDDTAWRELKPLGKADAPRPDDYCLTVAESQRLIEAADPVSGFRDLVRGALFTGARYGELCEMRVRDFQRECVVIPEFNSKNEQATRVSS